MRIRLISGLAAGVLGLAAACSSSSSPPVPDQDTTEFCADWAKAVCQLSSICSFDPTSCAAYQTNVCNDFVQQAQASGSRHYSQPAGKSCIDALNSAYGNSPSKLDSGTLATLNDTCNKAFTGNVGSDSACTSTYDCQGSLTCSPIPGQSASVCASGNTKDAGDICSAGDTCPTDYYCAPVMGAEPQCKQASPAGMPCSAQVPCDSKSYCASGTCQARAGVGQPCSSNDDCSSGAPYCDLYPPAVCTNGLTFARGSIDCNGIAGLDQTDSGGPTVNDAGTGKDGGTMEAATTDAPSGG